jgi:hypothetical protein
MTDNGPSTGIAVAEKRQTRRAVYQLVIIALLVDAFTVAWWIVTGDFKAAADLTTTIWAIVVKVGLYDQIYRIWRRPESVLALSPLYIGLGTFSYAWWVVHGIQEGDLVVAGGQALGVIGHVILCAQGVMYGMLAMGKRRQTNHSATTAARGQRRDRRCRRRRHRGKAG